VDSLSFFPPFYPSSPFCIGVAFIELLNEFWSGDVLGRLPTIMGLGISLPSKEILQVLIAPMSSDCKDLIYLILGFTFNQIR
jgi:hypothetical protein